MMNINLESAFNHKLFNFVPVRIFPFQSYCFSFSNYLFSLFPPHRVRFFLFTLFKKWSSKMARQDDPLGLGIQNTVTLIFSSPQFFNFCFCVCFMIYMTYEQVSLLHIFSIHIYVLIYHTSTYRHIEVCT